jgi:hypothetical protein
MGDVVRGEWGRWDEGDWVREGGFGGARSEWAGVELALLRVRWWRKVGGKVSRGVVCADVDGGRDVGSGEGCGC